MDTMTSGPSTEASLCNNIPSLILGKSQDEQQYWDSNFPSLIGYLGLNAKLPKARRSQENDTDSRDRTPKEGRYSTKRHFPVRQLSCTVDFRKRNENHWYKIDGIAKKKMEEFEEYSKRLRKHNEFMRVENERKFRQLYNDLWLQEEQKRKERLKNSAYNRIWEHHTTLRQRSRERKEKMEKSLRLSEKFDGERMYMKSPDPVQQVQKANEGKVVAAL